MNKKILLLTTVLLLSGMFASGANGEGLPVSKYMEDSEHASDIIGYYINALMSGITLANEKAVPKLFCVSDAAAAQGIYAMIDKRIAKLKKQKRFSSDMSVDTIVMEMLMEEFPCN